MLLQNFKVGYQILGNIARNSFSSLCFSKNVPQSRKIIKWLENKICLTPEPCKEKLQCPKSPFQEASKKLLNFSKPEPKVD